MQGSLSVGISEFPRVYLSRNAYANVPVMIVHSLSHDSKDYLADTSFRNHNYSFCLLQVGKEGEKARYAACTPRPRELKMMFFVIVVV